jgi:glycosyltransferase involved in cell wall biosynthesis
VTSRQRRVLFISPDAVGERMRGLGIRYTELAKALHRDVDVVVATGDRSESGPMPPGVRVVGYEPHAPSELRPEIAAADAIVAPPQWPVVTDWMRRSRARVVFDLYDPETLETLELFAGGRPAFRRLMVALTVDRLEDALRAGHHFMCAGESQRDLWIGAMLALRVLTPAAYDRDPTLRSVLDLVPFGVPSERPQRRGAGARGMFGQIAEGDEIVLWNGGLWRWLDAATAIRGMARLAARRPGVRLVFMGASDVPASQAAAREARELAESLGVLGDAVLFNEGWVPYAERADWLLGADCALATGIDHLETRFAFRTRLLDCFWAGLPVVCTWGDELADRVARNDLGAVVAPSDDEGLARAVEIVLDRGRAAYADALSRTAAAYEWEVVAEPLRRWVTSIEPPATLGAGSGPRLRRPGHLLRRAGYRAMRGGLERARRGWPSL